MIRYKFLLNHKQDEDYMAQMCREGWAAGKISGWFWLLAVLTAVYGVLCASLACSYTKLLKEMQK